MKYKSGTRFTFSLSVFVEKVFGEDIMRIFVYLNNYYTQLYVAVIMTINWSLLIEVG